MKERKIVFSARSIVILLSLVLCVSVVCGTVTAEKWVYVPQFPEGGDPASTVNPSLKSALEGDDDTIIVLTKNTSLGPVRITNTKTLVSYDPEGLVVKAGGTITIPQGAKLTLGDGVNEVTLKGAELVVSGTGNNKGTLVMNDRVNIVQGSADDGVISVQNGELILYGGNISNNGGKIVGGVHVFGGGTFDQYGGNITKNAGRIGAVSIENGGKYELYSGTVSENTASKMGGGVYVNGGGVFIQHGGDVRNNTAQNGGGVYLAADSSSGGTFTQNGGNIAFNSANKHGGGVYLAASEKSHATYQMTSGSLNNNTAPANGGGVYLATHFSSAKFTLSGGEIVNNTAGDTGGAVYLAPFTGAFYNQSYGESYAEGAVFSMLGGTIADNKASNAGGVYVSGEQKKMPDARYKFVQTIFDMSGGSIRNNTNTAVYVSAGKFNMREGEITQNTGPSYPVYIRDSPDYDSTLGVQHQGVFEMSGGSIYDNPGNRSYVYNDKGSVSLSGGTIYYTGETDTAPGVENLGTLEISGSAVISGFNNSGVLNYETLTVSGGTIMDNSGEDGGGIHNTGNLSLSGTGWMWNNTAREYGGGIYSNSPYPLNISGGVISENDAVRGGGVYTTNATKTSVLNMFGGMISNNTAEDLGGGIYGEYVYMSDGEISQNTADSGGAVVFTNEFTMTGGSLTSNSAVTGGALYMNKNVSTSMLFNMSGGSIWGNTVYNKSVSNGSAIYFTDGDFILGDSGHISEDNDVVIGEEQRINVTKNLTSYAGVYSIVPVKDKPKTTVVVVSVAGKNATDFIPNFNLDPVYSGSAYHNTLTPTESTIDIGHVGTPGPVSGRGGSGGSSGGVIIEAVDSFQVTFDPNNGVDVPEVYQVNNGSRLPKPEDPVYGAAEFVGWFTLYGYEWDFMNDTIDSPLVLYGNWNGDPYPSGYVVVPQAGETEAPLPIMAIVLGVVLIGAGVAVGAVLLLRKRNS